MILTHLNALEAIAKTTEKEQYVNENKHNELLKRVFIKANCPSVNFWIKQIPQITETRGEMSLDEALDQIESIIESREKTGHDARDFIKNILESLNERDSEVLTRIIQKQDKTKIGTKFLNKLYGTGTIRKFGYMRVSLYKDKIGNIQYPAFIQKKADGIFSNIIIEENGSVTYLTRNGTAFEVPSLSQINNPYGKKIVIHGEGVIINPNTITGVEDRQVGNGMINKFIKSETTLESMDEKITKAKTEAAAQKLIAKKEEFLEELSHIDTHLKFEVWDILDFDSWTNGLDNTEYTERFKHLNQIIEVNPDFRMSIIDSQEVNSLEEAHEFNNKMLSQGEEGSVLKNINSIWKDTTSTEMVKMKPEKDCDLIITGWYHGETGSEFEKGIGGFNMESSDGLLKVNVGSGLSREERGFQRVDVNDSAKGIELIDGFDFDQYTGKIAAVKFNYVIESKNKDTYSLFLPTLLEVREDKTEADNLEKIMNS